MRTDTLLALSINRLNGLRSAEKALLAEMVDTIEFYRSLDRHTLGQIIGRPVSEPAVLAADTLSAAERDYVFCEQRGVTILSYWDSRYPAALREIFDPPFLLFIRGRLPDSEKASIAVVGTREPSAEAVVAAEKLAEGVAAAGHTVVSGLARGIDAAAHRGALRSPGVATGAVLGCGIDRVYPASNRTLAAQILSGGGFIMSEYSPGVGPAKYHFPARNRIISGLCRGVVVVQAPAKSGALITADYALDQGRDLFVHAQGITGTIGAGARELADDGARIIDGAHDIFEEWGIPAIDPERNVSPADFNRSPATGREAGRTLADELRKSLVTGGADA